MGNKSITLRQVLAIALTVTIGSFYTMAPISARAQTVSKTAGELSVTGPVSLNGTKAVSGITIFSDSRIKTARNGAATVNLSKLGRVQLGQETDMTLRFSEGAIGGSLLSGRITLSAPPGVSVSVVTPDGVVTPDSKQATVMTVEVSSGKTRIAANRGHTTVASGNQTHQVAAGQEVSVGTDAAGQAGGTTGVGSTGGVGGVAGAGGAGASGFGSAVTGLVAGAMVGTAAGITAASRRQSYSVSPIKP